MYCSCAYIFKLNSQMYECKKVTGERELLLLTLAWNINLWNDILENKIFFGIWGFLDETDKHVKINY